jgi:hypothetical protein
LTMVVIMFFGALNTLGLALIGRLHVEHENPRRRPLAVIARTFEGTASRTKVEVVL